MIKTFLSVFSFLAASAATAAPASSSFPVRACDGKPATAELRWTEDGINDIVVREAKGKELAKIDGGGDWTNLGSENDRSRRDLVRAEDANFDGAWDLLVEQSSGTGGRVFKLFACDKAKGYVMSAALDEIWNPEFDGKKKQVVSKPADGRAKRYEWKDGKLTPAK